MLVLALGAPPCALSCDCRGPKPACAYVAADAIFLGRVSFTNDDGSGTFAQATLVRFDVEEQFKGVPTDIRQTWVDPGSFTSCYENYKLGERYLIFARKVKPPNGSSAVTIMRERGGHRKPIPGAFNSANPPTLYYAPECSGSRPADSFPHLDRDLAVLRAYRAGASLPRVLGNVHLYPFRGWPTVSGPALKAARITMSSGTATLVTANNGDGDFTLADAPAGDYSV